VQKVLKSKKDVSRPSEVGRGTTRRERLLASEERSKSRHGGKRAVTQALLVRAPDDHSFKGRTAFRLKEARGRAS